MIHPEIFPFVLHTLDASLSSLSLLSSVSLNSRCKFYVMTAAEALMNLIAVLSMHHCCPIQEKQSCPAAMGSHKPLSACSELVVTAALCYKHLKDYIFCSGLIVSGLCIERDTPCASFCARLPRLL